MRTIRRAGRWLSVLGVLAVALVAGLFLAACGKVAPAKGPVGDKGRKAEPPAASTKPAAAATIPPPSTAPARTSAPAKTVDVKETQQGQPVPRNLLE